MSGECCECAPVCQIKRSATVSTSTRGERGESSVSSFRYSINHNFTSLFIIVNKHNTVLPKFQIEALFETHLKDESEVCQYTLPQAQVKFITPT
jgi:SPX domain protein involved in polyphosphate accumulation